MVEKPNFEFQSTIEQGSFESQATQSFFTEWCKIDDSIKPEIITREEWIKKENILNTHRSLENDDFFTELNEFNLETNNRIKQYLFLPNDLQLWEMAKVVLAIDQNTFKDKPEKQNAGKEKILEQGKLFRNGGIYIAQRLDYIEQGKEYAKILACEFYDYGNALISGRKTTEKTYVGTIASSSLTKEETDSVDKFFASESLYQSRMKRIKEEPNNSQELERRHTLNQFFNILNKAYKLKQKSFNGEIKKTNLNNEPWKTNNSVHDSFISNFEFSIIQNIEIPKIELNASIFRRGMERLQKDVHFDKLPSQVKENNLQCQNGENTLREALQIDKLKLELKEVRENGDVKLITQKERLITNKIQQIVSKYRYEENSNDPSKIIISQSVDCLGASILGGSLMQEVGLNYLVGSVPRHSTLFLVTADNHVQLCDMFKPSINEDLTDKIIEGKNADGTPLTVFDIVKFSKNTKTESMVFNIKGKDYQNKFYWLKNEYSNYINLYKPEHGQKIQFLACLRLSLCSEGRNDEALECFEQLRLLNSQNLSLNYTLRIQDIDGDLNKIKANKKIILYNPEEALFYIGLGKTLFNLRRYKDSVEAYQKSIKLNCQNAYSYYILGNSFMALERFNDAISTYNKSIAINPEHALSYDGLAKAYYEIHQYKESIKAFEKYKRFLTNKDALQIFYVNKYILEMEDKIKRTSSF